MQRKSARFSSTSLFGLAIALSAVGAGAPVAAHAQEGAQEDVQDGASQQAEDNAQEIVVTAERRSQSLREVPIAATVITAGDLAARGVETVSDLQNVSPSLTFSSSSRTALVNVRGIGLNQTAPNVYQGVPFYMNGAFVPFDTTIRGTFYDIASVEVLRGPQGTLTGLNSTGGAVYVRSRAPRLGVLSGRAEQSLYSYDGAQTELAVNLPIGDRIAIRIAGMADRQDSYYTNLGSTSQPGDLDNYGIRADILWEPSDRLRINLRGEYYRSDTDGPAVKSRTDPNPDPFTLNEDAISNAVVNYLRTDLELNWQATDAFRVRYQFAYSEGYQFDNGDRNHAVGGASNNLAFTRIDPEHFAHELNFVSASDGPLQWVAGVFYLESSNPTILVRYADCCRPIGAGLIADLGIDNSSQAIFGQASYEFDEHWKITAGLRYSKDEQTMTRIAGLAAIGVPSETTVSSDAITGRLALNYTIDDDAMLYASLSRGSKPGGVNLAQASGTYGPETVDLVEFGAKTRIFDRRLTVNAALFYSEYSNAQFQSVASGFSVVRNAPLVVSQGAELELFGNFGDLSFNLGAAYLDSSFGAEAVLVNPITNLLEVVPKGRAGVYAPDWTFNAGVQYDFHLGRAGTLTPRLQLSYLGGQFQTAFPDGPTPASRLSFVPSRAVLDARLTYVPNDRLRLELFVNNLTDEVYLASQQRDSSSLLGGYIYGAPRVAGFRVAFSFNE